MTTERLITADDLPPMTQLLVGDDGQSHIVSAMGDLWCEEEMEVHDEATDLDCPSCIIALAEDNE